MTAGSNPPVRARVRSRAVPTPVPPAAPRGEATVQVAHTAALDPEALVAARELLDIVFDGELTDEDWDHGLGGMHALVWQDGHLVGHGSVVQRQLLHGGRARRVGYVEAVGVHPDRQRRGIGGLVLDALEAVIAGGYELGALASTDEGLALYRRRGWLPWRGRTSAMTPAGIRRTPDGDDCVHVFPLDTPMDLDGELVCDWREGDVW
ncbi:MAG: GNAT family N-acetyltransferase [Actinomycetota bacterium]|nr:GNAT family N-acetyltransferase [Actinomycetota bacterium]